MSGSYEQFTIFFFVEHFIFLTLIMKHLIYIGTGAACRPKTVSQDFWPRIAFMRFSMNLLPSHTLFFRISNVGEKLTS